MGAPSYLSDLGYQSGDVTDISQDPSLSVSSFDPTTASSSAVDSTTGSVQGLLGSLAPLGFSVASAITGQPVVQTPGGALALGQKPVVTGQVNITTLLFFGAAIIVIVLVMRGRSA